MKFAVITPAYNEAEFIHYTINSVIAQSVKPEIWIIVNDGSTDHTQQIVENLIQNQTWIQLINIPLKEKHSSGGHVAQVFSEGQRKIDLKKIDFLVKLDADLTLPENYFEKIAGYFKDDDALGICGGVCAIFKNGNWEVEKVADDDHLRGAIKAYRTNLFELMGGIRPVEGWDTLDELICIYHHFKVKVDPDLIVLHHRITDKKTGQVNANLKTGRALHIMGYSLLISFISSLKRYKHKPFLIGTFLTFAGYLLAAIKGETKAVSEEEARFINKFRLNRILKKLTKSFGSN